MKKLLVMLGLAVALLAGCATSQVTPTVDTYPLVLKNTITCATVEYQIGEWQDENQDGIVTEAEWFVMFSGVLEPEDRVELGLPAGVWLAHFVVHKSEGDEGAWMSWVMPAQGLKPNEKPVIMFECVHPEDGSDPYTQIHTSSEK